MKKPFISLCNESIEEISALCKLVKQDSPDNEISQKMASGISSFADEHMRVSHEQARWLCRNFDYRHKERPAELVNVPVTDRSDKNALFAASDTKKLQTSDKEEILKCLRRIESIIA